jgi:hypothetical protein
MRKYNEESFNNIKLVLEDNTLAHRCSKISIEHMIKANKIIDSSHGINYHTKHGNNNHISILRSANRGLERITKTGHTNNNVITCEPQDV